MCLDNELVEAAQLKNPLMIKKDKDEQSVFMTKEPI
jgi:hypothetical protein